MSARTTVSLSLPAKVLAVLGQPVAIKVGVTDFSGTDRDILVRLIGSLSGPLPAVAHRLAAHLSLQAEVSMQVPAGMPPGDHPILIEVLDRSTGAVIGQGEVLLDVQHTRSIAMHLSPPSIRRRLRGRIRVVLRNHDDETHHLRIRAESDDSHTKVKLFNQDIELRAGEVVRIKGRLNVRPFFIGKQKEHWYSIIGDGAGSPIYSRGNVRHIPMIGRNIKSLMGLMCVVLVWAGATLAIIRAVDPVTTESSAGAEGPIDGETGTDSGSSGELELPLLVDVSGTVTATPDGSNVVVKWRAVSIGDVEGSGKVSGSSSLGNPNVANLSTTTDAEGAFSVAGLDGSGLYEFTFSKAGHSTKTIIVQPNGESVTREIELSVGDGTASGITLDENGNPLGGVDVKITDGTITYQTTTPSDGDQIGRFTFNNLSTPATYFIDARQAQRGLASQTLYLDAGSSINDLSLTLSPDVTTLSGRVTSVFFSNRASAATDGSANSTSPSVSIPAVTVTATDGKTTLSTTTLTDPSLAGSFRLEGLPVGRTYTVTYATEGFITFTEIIELTIDTPERSIAMSRSTGRMSGTVTVDSADIAAQTVAITVANSLDTYKSTDLIRNDGTYDFNGIKPGNYVVTFEALGLEDQYREVDIGAGTAATIDVTMTELADNTRSSSLNFVVTKKGEEPDTSTPAAVSVSVKHRAPGDCGTVGNLTNCQYPTTIVAGTNTTTVVIDELDAGAYYLVFTAEGFSPKVVQTSVALGEEKEQIEVSLDALGTLSGQVTDDSGSPVEGVQLLLTSASGVRVTGSTGSNGEFTFDNALDAMTYTLGTTSSNFTNVTRTVTGALNASVNVDATVRGISMVTGEVRSLNLSSGNYEAVEAKNFSVFYRPTIGDSTNPVTGSWIDTKTIGISKSLGSFRLGVNPVDENGDAVLFDACIAIVNGTVAGAQMTSAACDAAVTATPMPPGLSAKASRSIGLQVGETAVRSIYFSPNSGSLTGYVTVGGVAETGVKVEARRISPDGRIFETVSGSTTDGGSFKFDFLTPTAPVAPTDYDENAYAPCDNVTTTCWFVRATKTSVGSKDSEPFTIYPSKRLNLQVGKTIDIEVGKGSLTVSLSADTGAVISVESLTITATINGLLRTVEKSPDSSGKFKFDNLDIGSWNLTLPATDDFAAVNRDFNISQGVALNESIVRRSLRGKIVFYLRGPGGPLAGAEIRLAPSTSTDSPTTTTSTGDSGGVVLCTSIEDGSCTVNNYDSGVHTFIASKAGLSSTTISASVIGGQTIAVSADLGAASGTLTVTLLDVLGKPLVGATIMAKDASLKDFSCSTNNSGVCTLTGIPFGIVEVKASAPDYRDSFGSISIGSGGSAMTLIAAPTNGVATFVFVDENGQAIYPVKAEYLDGSNNVVKSCDAIQTNQCIIAGLPQGLATIRASVTGEQASQYLPATIKVSVFPGLDTSATFVMTTANASFSGTVIEEAPVGTVAVPVSGAIVTATDNAGKSEVTLTDDAGKFSFSKLTSGSWTIRSSAPGYATKTIAAVQVPTTDYTIKVTPLSGSIELSVRTPIGGPAAGISVIVQKSVDNADSYPIVTGSDGNAIFDQSTIVEGTYSVTITDSVVPPRFVSQSFLLNVDRGASTRFAVYLGTNGTFLAVPIAGIPASGFGPPTPLSVDVALIKDGLLYHQVSTSLVANQMVASFAGVAAGEYSIVIQSPNTLTQQPQIAVTNVLRGFDLKVRYTTSSPHGLAEGDIVDLYGFAKTAFNVDNAVVTAVIDAVTFDIEASTGTSALPTGTEYATAKMSKVSGQSQWNLAAHTIVTNSSTYDVPEAPKVTIPELSRTITLGLTSLIVTPVDFNVEVTGIPETDPTLATTTVPGSTTLPRLGNAKVTLSDGYLLNSISKTTDSNGIASFTDIPPGTYTATVSNTSYDNFVTTIQIVDSSDPSGNNPKISLVQTPVVGSIEVSVSADGDSNKKLSGATVSVLENNATCITDSSGICEIKNLLRGDYNLRVIHPNYATINTRPIHVTGGLKTTHTVLMGADNGAVNFTVFNNATGLPINAAKITAQVVVASSETRPSCSTTIAGKCTIGNLSLGATSFRVEATDFDVGFVGLDIVGGFSTNITINLTPSLPTTETLKIRAVDAVTGLALNGVEVSNADNDDLLCKTLGSVGTPPVAAGACDGLEIPVGNLSVRGDLENYETAFATVVIAPIYSTTVVLALRPKLGSLRFDLVNAVGNAPLAGAQVSVITDPSSECTTIPVESTPARASCTISALPLVNTTFLVEKDGYDDVYVSYAITNEGGAVRVQMVPSANTLVINTVDAVTGSPLAGALIEYGTTDLCTTSGVGANCTTALLPTGSYSLKVTKEGYEDLFSTVPVNAQAPTSMTFALRPIFGAVTFVVRDAVTRALVPNATVVSVDEAADQCVTPATPTTGSCTIGNLALVATEFEISAASYDSALTNVTVTNVAGSKTTVYLTKDSTSLKVYTLDAVTDEPLVGVTVEYENGDSFCTTATNVNGSGYCSVSGLAAGTITLKAFKTGFYLPAYATLTYDTNAPVALTIALAPMNGTAIFSVVDGDTDLEVNGVVVTPSPSGTACTTASLSGCSVANFPVGTYVFTATKSGYTTAVVVATIVNTDDSNIALTMYPTSNKNLKVYTFNESSGSALDGVTVTRADGTSLCAAATSGGFCTANTVAVGEISVRGTLTNHSTAYGNVTIGSSGEETLYLYLRPLASTVTVTVLNSYYSSGSTAINGANVYITGGSCGTTNGNGVSICTGITHGDLTLSVNASYFSSGSATISVARGSQNSVVLYLTPWGYLTVSTIKKATSITASIQNYGDLCTISALSGTEPPVSGECTGYYLPYGTYIVSINTSPIRTATVTINKPANSLNFP